MKENKAMTQKIWKISVLYSKTSKEFYHQTKISEKYNEQKVFYKKTVLNNFAIFTEKYLCWCLFFNKNAGLHACNSIKKRLKHRYFLVNIAKFLRTPILKNICEQLVLRVFPLWQFARFPTRTNNITSYIGGEEDVFSKTKQKNHFKS